jgi:hypothetical protein
LNRARLFPLIIAFAVSCAKAPPSGEPVPQGNGTLAALFPPQASASGGELEIFTRVRLDLPKYRIRGTCELYRAPDGSVQIDFVHSSLFGSYREDATIYIRGDSISIQDNERGVFRGSAETLAHLEEYLGFSVIAEDIIVFMLLGTPGLEDMGEPVSSVSGRKWRLSGEWRGRLLEIEGEKGRGPLMLRICPMDGKGCYEARYGYSQGGGLEGYPERIVCERTGSSEMLSVTVESVVCKKNGAGLEQAGPGGVTEW